MWFFAGIIIGVAIGFLASLLLLWVAKHYPDFDDPYDDNDLFQ